MNPAPWHLLSYVTPKEKRDKEKAHHLFNSAW